jgi:hypothetical protein
MMRPDHGDTARRMAIVGGRTEPVNKLLFRTVLAVAVLAVALQIVPYGRDHTNPPVRREPAWDRPETRELARRACFARHSNETTWPWYANVAPASWLTQHDVDDGRHAVNFSEWDRPQREAKDAAKVVPKGEMPPWLYAMGHPDAAEPVGALR